jgi:hypothetical protein
MAPRTSCGSRLLNAAARDRRRGSGHISLPWLRAVNTARSGLFSSFRGETQNQIAEVFAVSFAETLADLHDFFTIDLAG